MNREERQHKILTLLKRETGISAGELSCRLQVSRMTIHRDLKSLRDRDLLLRIRGGAVSRMSRLPTGSDCSVCERSLSPHQRSEVICAAGPSFFTCCAACALRQMLVRSDIEQLFVGDQISGLLLPAGEAFFLVNSLAVPCCQPSFLSFAREEEVSLFQAGFGGTIARLEQALEFIRIAADLG